MEFGAEVNIKVQSIFEHVQIFITSAEEGFDVGADFNALSFSSGFIPRARKRCF